MKASYTLTPESLKIGASYHYAHRSGALGLLRTCIGVFLLMIAALQLTDGGGPLTIVFIILGFLNLFAKQIGLGRTVKKAFKARPKTALIKFNVGHSGIFLESDESCGRTKWGDFVDYVIKRDGILIYPHQKLYHWIPKSAEFTEGSWDEFTAVVKKNIKKK